VLGHALKIGFCFGLTSGTITTLGLMVGLSAGTGSRLAVIGGILTIAIADGFADALGIHISEESENVHTPTDIWAATVATFCSKFVFALTFLVPVVFLDLPTAIVVSVIWGLAALCVLSLVLARRQGVRPGKVIAEHLVIALLVVFITHNIGQWIATWLQ